MKKFLFLLSTLIFLIAVSCGSDDDVGTSDSWLIPIAEIFDGGPGKDGIPSVDNPAFTSISEIDFLEEDDLIIGIKIGNQIKAYPHPILDWHEIVNDDFDNGAVALTYCPLTGTAIGWDRNVNGQKTTFGVSGLLYNSNLIPYDRGSDSNWSQMRLQCVEGELSGRTPDMIPVVETTWATWKNWYPDGEVMSTSTGFSRNYGSYPYGDYRDVDRLIFPISVTDNRASAKERVLGVFGGDTQKAYRFSSFTFDENDRGFIADQIGGEEVLVVASQEAQIIVAYSLRNTQRSFTSIANQEEGFFADADGDRYDVFGKNISGGTDLKLSEAFIGYWFSWGTFYPEIELYGE